MATLAFVNPIVPTPSKKVIMSWFSSLGIESGNYGRQLSYALCSTVDGHKNSSISAANGLLTSGHSFPGSVVEVV